jgi:hypothetical protein
MTKTKLPKDQWFDEDVPSDSPVIDELRRLLKEARKKQREKGRLQKQKAGKTSGVVRKGSAEQRLQMVKRAYDQLDPKYKVQPYSKDSIDALYEQFLVVLGIKRDRPPRRPPPTEDELRSFGLDIESISQLPEADRMDALRDAVRYFEDNVTPPGITLTGDDALQALLQEKERENVTIDLTHLPPSQLDIDEVMSKLFPACEMDNSEIETLSRISSSSLRQCLAQLGVKGKRQARRPK